MMFVKPMPIIWKEPAIPKAVPWGGKKNTAVWADINLMNQVSQDHQVTQAKHLELSIAIQVNWQAEPTR